MFALRRDYCTFAVHHGKSLVEVYDFLSVTNLLYLINVSLEKKLFFLEKVGKKSRNLHRKTLKLLCIAIYMY